MKDSFLLVLMTVVSHLAFAQPCVVAHRGLWSAEGSAKNSLTSLRMVGEAECLGS